MCERTNYRKTSNTRIDKCMVNFIGNLNARFTDLITVGCCCGHFRYPMTIICRSSNGRIFDLVSGVTIPRKRNFYKKDKLGYYYIPEIIKKG